MTIPERVIAAYQKALNGIATVKEAPKSEVDICFRFSSELSDFETFAVCDLRAQIVFDNYLDKGNEPIAIESIANCVHENQPLRFNYLKKTRVFLEPYIAIPTSNGLSARPNPEYHKAARQIMIGKTGRASISICVETNGHRVHVYRSLEIVEMPQIYEMDVPHLNLVAA